MRKVLTSLAVALALFLPLFAPISPAQAAEASDLTATGTRAFDDLTRCINSTKKLDIYYLIDESGSLKSTDPGDTRAEILASSLRTLGAFKDVSITYSYGFFGEKFDNSQPWTSVDANSVDRAADSLAREVRERKNSSFTNWLVGIEGAARELQAQSNKTQACQALIWLTDGGLWIGQDGNRKTIDQGKVDDAADMLCNTVFETLRKRQVSVFGVLLKNEAALKRLQETDRVEYEETLSGMAWMRPLLEGTGAVEPGLPAPSNCGTVPIPANQAAGALLIAQDPVALALQFLILTSTTEGGTSIDFDPNNIVIEKGVRKFRILSTSRSWELLSPTGAVYSSSSPGVEVVSQNGVNQISVTAPVLELGIWKFTFEKAARSNNRLILFSGLELSLSESTLVGGTDGKISGRVVVSPELVANSAPVKLSDYLGEPNFKIFEIPASGEQIRIPGARIQDSGSFSVAFYPTTSKGVIELRVTLNLSTKSGIKLAPISLSSKLDVKLPEEFPSIGSPIVLSTLEGPNGNASGEIVIEGPVRGSGAACFSMDSGYGIQIVQDKVSRAGNYSWTLKDLPADGCVKVSQGGTERITISVTNAKSADSEVIADLPVRFISDSKPGQDLKVSRSIEFESTVIRIGEGFLQILLFLIGILLPLGLIYLMYWFTSKLAFGPGMQRHTFPILIDSTKGILNRDGTKLVGSVDHFKPIPLQDDARSYKEQGNGEIRLRLNPIPLAEPWFEYEVAAGARAITVARSAAIARKRFATGEIAPVSADMGEYWAIIIKETDLQSNANKSSMPATLVVYKRMRQGVTDQNRDRVERITKIGGLWERVLALRATPLSGRAKKTDAVVAADPVAAYTPIPAPPGAAPPPPPGMTPPPPPGMTPPPPPGRG
jgi:hypothetical protein